VSTKLYHFYLPSLWFVSRVCEVTLLGDKTFSLRQQKYKVSEALKTGEVTTLFGAAFVLSLAIPFQYFLRLSCRLRGRFPHGHPL
jgi:hypothetical protein